MLWLWISYRQRGEVAPLAGCVLLYTVALGIKETSVVAPALILLLDCVLLRFRWDLRLLKPYLWFALPVAAFFAFVVFYRHTGLHATEAPGRSFYGGASVMGTTLAEVRDILNLLLPFGPQFSLHDLHGRLVIELFLVAVFIAILGVAAKTARRVWMLAILWIGIALLPTCVFARMFNQNYYLFLASFGLAVAVSYAVNVIAERRASWLNAVFLAGYLLYAFAGTAVLRRYASHWAYEAGVAQYVVNGVKRVLPTPGPFTIVAVNLPEAFENGFRGALLGNGYDARTAVIGNAGDQPDPVQRVLAQAVATCPHDGTSKVRTLLM